LMLPSHPDTIICIFALAKIGAVRVPINPNLIGAALIYPFEAFSVDFLIADTSYEEILAEALEKYAPRKTFWRNAEGIHQDTLEELLNYQDAAPPAVEPEADDIVAITPSSGTTGAPKGVLKSDRTLRAGPIAILRLTEAKPGETLFLWEALHHGAGVAVVIAAVLGKLTLGMVDRFSASRFWAQAKEVGATRIHYLGSVLPMILKQPSGPNDRRHGVTIAWGGGCPAEIWNAVEERFGVQIREGYGLSELVTFCTMNLDGKIGSIGKPLSWYEAMVRREDGHPCVAGEVGELCFRARHPGLGFLGYYNNEAASREVMAGEWFRTGDLARQDEGGYLTFAGRLKDSIRRRGINISAWEVERVILEHSSVEEVALVGVPSDLGEDEIKIFLRVAEGATLGAREIFEWCTTRLPIFQLPRYIEFVQDFPRTPTQRIQKRELSRSVENSVDTNTFDALLSS
jgi:crotonobetaine/carnitine-CoA ligase